MTDIQTAIRNAKGCLKSLGHVNAEFVFAENGPKPVRFTTEDLKIIIDHLEKTPDGFMMLPIDPTSEMKEAGQQWIRQHGNYAEHVWIEMIRAWKKKGNAV